MRVSVALRLSIVAALLGLGAGTAAAQAIDCNRLSMQIASLGRNDGSPRMAEAAQKQAGELARTQAYARSLGCDKPQFLFFGNKPAQCDGLNAQIQRMQANYANLARAAGGDTGLKRQLQQQFDAYCRGGVRREPNFLEKLFGVPERTYPPMLEELPPSDEQQQEAGTPRGGPMAVCVRSCDGGFFPLTYDARRADLSQLQQLCTALCPNTEARLFTRSQKDMKSAVSIDGEAYVDTPNAFKFEKTADSTCTCKPPNKTWAEALADAEALLESRKGDIIVTPEKAEELSRPQAAGGAGAKPPAAGKKRKFDPSDMQKVLDQRRAADAETAADGALAAQAPTAGTESSGIAPTRDSTATILRDSQGVVRETRTADGKSRKLRVLAPE